MHVIPRYSDEPMAGKGVRFLFKSKENERNKYNLK
jgi:histidine triad (HIT) family protein